MYIKNLNDSKGDKLCSTLIFLCLPTVISVTVQLFVLQPSTHTVIPSTVCDECWQQPEGLAVLSLNKSTLDSNELAECCARLLRPPRCPHICLLMFPLIISKARYLSLPHELRSKTPTVNTGTQTGSGNGLRQMHVDRRRRVCESICSRYRHSRFPTIVFMEQETWCWIPLNEMTDRWEGFYCQERHLNVN